MYIDIIKASPSDIEYTVSTQMLIAGGITKLPSNIPNKFKINRIGSENYETF